jgi:hypothetical protein
MEILLNIGLMAVLFLVPLWKIFGKAGMSPWFSLFVLFPGLGGLICILVLAFARWPATAGADGR